MFTLPKQKHDHRSDHGYNRRNSRDNLEQFRQFAKKEKRDRMIIHSLLHDPCELCRFPSTGYCRKCCLPACYELTKGKDGWKKMTKNYSLTKDKSCLTNKNLNIQQHLLSSIIVGQQQNLDSKKNLSVATITPGVSNNCLNKVQELNNTRPASRNTQISSNDLNQQQQQSQMDTNIAVQTVQPTAPSLGHHLLNSEEQVDVVFLVGPKNEFWRFPSHSQILKSASPYFQSLLSDLNQNNNKEIRIDWCDPNYFEIIQKYAYTNEIVFKSVTETMHLLYVSYQFAMNQLSMKCLTFLKKQCDEENVLRLLPFIFEHFKMIFRMEKEPNSEIIKELFVLIWTCFDVIDKNASKLLASDDFTMLNREMVINIVCRDSLKLESELDVYNGIINWATQQCKQQRKEITDQNKRQFLEGDLIYFPRYLTMNLNEFGAGPNQDEILTSDEKNILLRKINGDNVNLPKSMEQFPMNVKRNYEESNNILEDDIEKPFNSKLTKSVSFESGFPFKKKNRPVHKKIIKGLGVVGLAFLKVLD